MTDYDLDCARHDISLADYGISPASERLMAFLEMPTEIGPHLIGYDPETDAVLISDAMGTVIAIDASHIRQVGSRLGAMASAHEIIFAD